MLKPADEVWNRACFHEPDASRPGDVALHALLKAHGMVMNGGVLHCVEVLDENELDAAKRGYRYFGFNQLVDIIERAAATPESEAAHVEAELDRAYAAIIPTDSVLVSRFEADFAKNPGAYGPVE